MLQTSSQESFEPTRQSLELKWREVERKHRLKFKITEDRDEAIEIVARLLGQGEQVVISVPDEHIEYIRKNGIPQIPQADRSGRGEHYSVLAGRLGSDPYFNLSEERWIVEVDPDGLDIQPRMTGKDQAFYGTVTVGGEVPSGKLSVIGKFSRESWEAYLKEIEESGRRRVAA